MFVEKRDSGVPRFGALESDLPALVEAGGVGGWGEGVEVGVGEEN